MGFISYRFLLCFLPLLFICYKCIGGNSAKRQNVILLTGSIIFYASYGISNLLILAFCVLLTWGGVLAGSYLRGSGRARQAKTVLIGSLVLNLAVLVICKYSSFFLENIAHFTALQLLLPAGLSFYVFQSSSYILDYYFGKAEPERDLIDYAVFVCFFPTIVSGPIQKSRDFLPKLKESRAVTFEDHFMPALYMFLWGVFLKLVLADRLNILTNNIFDNYTIYSGWVLVLGAASYSLQIYADFSSYSSMALAIAMLFGFELEPNFRQPYFATGIADFWRRWHISLTSWFREYLYIPLGGNRKGRARQYFNIMAVFLVSGIWHGAGLSFIVWGCLHGLYQIIGLSTDKFRKRITDRLHIDRSSGIYRIWQSVIVFILAGFAWIFFRAPSLKTALSYILSMISLGNFHIFTDRTLLMLGWTMSDWIIALAAIVSLFTVSYFKEHGENIGILLAQKVPVKYICFLILIVFAAVFGIYGPEYEASAFIYAGF